MLMVMNKEKAKEILMAHSCCTLSNRDNLLCHVCPWYNKKECEEVRFTDELIMNAVAVIKGYKSMKRIKLDKIYVTQAFVNTAPSPEKIERCREYYKKNSVQAKPIVISKNGALLDGYIQYLILKENGAKTAVVIQKNRPVKKENVKEPTYRNTKTTYIYGIHPNSNCIKEFCWRVPASWGNWADNLQIMDTILCSTKNGFAPVVVNRIEILDKCPIDSPVKKVARKEIRRNGIIVTE